MAVTTALCADQVVRAAPASRPQVSEIAGRIVQRLTASFGRTVADVAPVRAVESRASAARTTVKRLVVIRTARVEHRCVTPFQFRLPPPSLA